LAKSNCDPAALQSNFSSFNLVWTRSATFNLTQNNTVRAIGGYNNNMIGFDPITYSFLINNYTFEPQYNHGTIRKDLPGFEIVVDGYADIGPIEYSESNSSNIESYSSIKSIISNTSQYDLPPNIIAIINDTIISNVSQINGTIIVMNGTLIISDSVLQIDKIIILDTGGLIINNSTLNTGDITINGDITFVNSTISASGCIERGGILTVYLNSNQTELFKSNANCYLGNFTAVKVTSSSSGCISSNEVEGNIIILNDDCTYQTFTDTGLSLPEMIGIISGCVGFIIFVFVLLLYFVPGISKKFMPFNQDIEEEAAEELE